MYEFWGSHGGVDGDGALLGCDAMWILHPEDGDSVLSETLAPTYRINPQSVTTQNTSVDKARLCRDLNNNTFT
jgi:hypothetical protein